MGRVCFHYFTPYPQNEEQPPERSSKNIRPNVILLAPCVIAYDSALRVIHATNVLGLPTSATSITNHSSKLNNLADDLLFLLLLLVLEVEVVAGGRLGEDVGTRVHQVDVCDLPRQQVRVDLPRVLVDEVDVLAAELPLRLVLADGREVLLILLELLLHHDDLRAELFEARLDVLVALRQHLVPVDDLLVELHGLLELALQDVVGELLLLDELHDLLAELAGVRELALHSLLDFGVAGGVGLLGRLLPLGDAGDLALATQQGLAEPVEVHAGGQRLLDLLPLHLVLVEVPLGDRRLLLQLQLLARQLRDDALREALLVGEVDVVELRLEGLLLHLLVLAQTLDDLGERHLLLVHELPKLLGAVLQLRDPRLVEVLLRHPLFLLFHALPHRPLFRLTLHLQPLLEHCVLPLHRLEDVLQVVRLFVCVAQHVEDRLVQFVRVLEVVDVFFGLLFVLRQVFDLCVEFFSCQRDIQGSLHYLHNLYYRNHQDVAFLMRWVGGKLAKNCKII